MAPWLEQEEADNWEQQTRIVTIQGQLSERNLMTLVHFYNKSMDDSHTLQWLQGCDVEPDRHLCLWYNQLAYDSEDLPTLSENPSSCTVGKQWETALYLRSLSTWRATAQICCRNTWKKGRRGCCVQTPQRHM